MKTSNKILLGAFITCLLVLTAIHVALYAKIKSGDFTYIKDTPKENSKSQKLPANVRYVSITGLSEVVIVPAESFSFSEPNTNHAALYYKITGDTLVLRPDSSHIALSEIPQGGAPVLLQIPSGMHITGNYCALVFAGSTDTTNAPYINFDLYNSNLTIGEGNGEQGGEHFKGLAIRAQHESALTFQNSSSVGELNVELANSTMEDDRAFFGKLFLSADDSSKVTLTVGNLKKLNLTPKK